MVSVLMNYNVPISVILTSTRYRRLPRRWGQLCTSATATLPLRANINSSNNQQTNEWTNDERLPVNWWTDEWVGGPAARLDKACGSCCYPATPTPTPNTYKVWNALTSYCCCCCCYYCYSLLVCVSVCLYIPCCNCSLCCCLVLPCHDSANFPGNCCGHGQTQPVNANIDYNKKIAKQQHQTSSTTFARVEVFAASPDCITYCCRCCCHCCCYCCLWCGSCVWRWFRTT